MFKEPRRNGHAILLLIIKFRAVDKAAKENRPVPAVGCERLRDCVNEVWSGLSSLLFGPNFEKIASEIGNLRENIVSRALVRRDEHEMLFESLNGVAGGSNNIISGSVATTGSSSGSSSPSVWLLQASNEYDLDQWIDAIEPSSWKEVLPSTSTQDASSRMHEENESARQKKSALF